MEKGKGKIMRFIELYGRLVIIGLLIIGFGGSLGYKLLSGVNPKLTEQVNSVVSVLIDESLDNKIDPLITQINAIAKVVDNLQDGLNNKPDAIVIVMELSFNQYDTAAEVDIVFDDWARDQWTAQQGFAKYILVNSEAKRQFKEAIIYDEVYKRFLLRARRIP